MKPTSSIKRAWLLTLALVALFLHGSAALAVTKLLKPGSDEEALAYYGRISGELGFKVGESNLSDLVNYLGYRGLSAGDLEFIEPGGLAPKVIDDLLGE